MIDLLLRLDNFVQSRVNEAVWWMLRLGVPFLAIIEALFILHGLACAGRAATFAAEGDGWHAGVWMVSAFVNVAFAGVYAWLGLHKRSRPHSMIERMLVWVCSFNLVTNPLTKTGAHLVFAEATAALFLLFLLVDRVPRDPPPRRRRREVPNAAPEAA